MKKRIIKLFLYCSIFYCFLVLAKTPLSAQNSYVTIVNPVRSRIFWQNQDALNQQLQIMRKINVSATWLIQYSNLFDESVVKILKNIPSDHEVGLFFEVDEKLADDSDVSYLHGDGDWARPDKVFLSGYLPVDRLAMIDRAFGRFREVFGYSPKSVGAWYIDTVSLNYMYKKYGISAVLDCSDQFQTDKYGLWGKPWGNPYYPSRLNALIPTQSNADKLDVVRIQWAQRDPVLGYGLTVHDSTYSIQANDYLSHSDLPVGYFENLAQSYLMGKNRINQLTLGLEVGQEGTQFAAELEKQLKIISSYKNYHDIKFVTMSEFADGFKSLFATDQPNFLIYGSDWRDRNRVAYWISTAFYRAGLIVEKNNLILRDLRDYSRMSVFDDVADKDAEKNLRRFIPYCIDELLQENTLVLSSGIYKTEVKSLIEYFELAFWKQDGSLGSLQFAGKSVSLDGKIIFEAGRQTDLFDRFNRLLLTALMDAAFDTPHGLKRSFRFSKIEDVWYFGFMVSRDMFVGIRTKLPFIGKFNFPFQVLSRFRTIPRLNTLFYLLHLVNDQSKCKIKL